MFDRLSLSLLGMEPGKAKRAEKRNAVCSTGLDEVPGDITIRSTAVLSADITKGAVATVGCDGFIAANARKLT